VTEARKRLREMIVQDLREGVLTYSEVAAKHGVERNTVYVIAKEMYLRRKDLRVGGPETGGPSENV
jgi:transposase-like protein